MVDLTLFPSPSYTKAAFENGGGVVGVIVGVLEATGVGVLVGVRLGPGVGVRDGVAVGPLDVSITSWGHSLHTPGWQN